MAQNLREQVAATMRKVLGANVDLKNTGLQLSSLKMLELIVAIETEFNIHIPESAPLAEITSSLDSILTYLEKLLPSR
jgi:acyl carrier protein